MKQRWKAYNTFLSTWLLCKLKASERKCKASLKKPKGLYKKTKKHVKNGEGLKKNKFRGMNKGNKDPTKTS